MSKKAVAKLAASPAQIDTPRMFLLLAGLLDRLTAEMQRGMPSHTWADMGELRRDTMRLKAELEEWCRGGK